MAAAGLDDIPTTGNILGESKIRRLVALTRRCRVAVAVDNPQVVDGLSGVQVALEA